MEPNGAKSLLDAPRWSWPSTLLCAAAIALAGVAAYWNSLDGQFMFDDQGWIVDNPSIRHLWPPGELLFPANGEHVGGRPVVSLSLALNYAIGGLDVRGYHAVNIAIHVLTALVLFGVARQTLVLASARLSGSAAYPLASAATPLALAIALVWVVHPLNTEAVSYVIQRAESLVSLLYLLTLYAVIRGATAESPGGSPLSRDGSPQPSRPRAARLWYSAAVLFCLFGMATKEVMVTAPITVLLYDVVFLAGSLRRAVAERWRLYLAMATTWGVLAWTLTATHFHAETTGLGVKGFTPLTYLLTEPAVILHYLRLAFWPDWLCFAYDLSPTNSPEQIVLPGLAIIALLALVVWALVKRPMLGFLGAAFFLILAPTSSFVPILDAAFEHRMYLALAPLVALAIVVCFWFWHRLVAGSRQDADRTARAVWTLAPAIAGIIVGLAMVTVARNRDYRTELAIWRDTVNKRPENWRAHYNLGHALSAERRSAEAIKEYRETLRLDPNYPQALQNLGAELALQGKLDEAIPLFEHAIAVDPTYAEAHFNLAVALSMQGHIHAAVRHYRDAVKIKPGDHEWHKNLGMLLWRQGDFSGAAAEFEEAIRLKPSFVKPRAALASLLCQQGRLGEAAAQARRAVEIDPHAADSHAALADVLAAQGDGDAAIAEYQNAIAIDPDQAECHFHLGLLLDAKAESSRALVHLRRAALLQPTRPEFLSRLTWALATNPDESLRDGVTALELARRAMQMAGPRDPLVLAARAAAEAEVGRYPQAVQFAEQAVEVAETLPNQDAFLAATREQIKLYESGVPYRAAAHR